MDEAARLIAPAAAGAPSLSFGGASALATLPAPFLLRLAVGTARQEDLSVAELTPLHGAGADGRYRARLRAPALHSHETGEPARAINATDLLRTRFEIYVGDVPASCCAGCAAPNATRLFDALLCAAWAILLPSGGVTNTGINAGRGGMGCARRGDHRSDHR